MKRFFTVAASAALASASAVAATPAGLWKTIDDSTGSPRSLIRITEANGEYKGTIEKLFRTPDQEQNPKCDKCEGPLKDKPITGMTILTGLRQDGNEFGNGKILDPENGKVYSSKASLDDSGKKLEVRGFVGFSMFGRSQTWVRAD